MTGAQFLQMLLKIGTHPFTLDLAKAVQPVIVRHMATMNSPPVTPEQPDVQAKAEAYNFEDVDGEVVDAEVNINSPALSTVEDTDDESLPRQSGDAEGESSRTPHHAGSPKRKNS